MREKLFGVRGWLGASVVTALLALLVWQAGPTAVTPAASALMETRSSVSLVADVSDRRLYVKKGGEVIRSYPVAVGRPGNPTPRGSFAVRHLVWNPRWVPPDADWAKDKTAKAPGDPRNPMGRVKIYFREPDYYIHGTRELDSLGKAESRGCIRMRNADVIALGRLVMREGGSPRDPSWFRRVLNRVTRSQEVYMDRAVPLTVRS